MEFKQYRRTQIAEMADWEPGFDMTCVSISNPDAANGSPKLGDKIARNPANHADKWLVAKAYFEANFAPMAATPEAVNRKLVEALEKIMLGPCIKKCGPRHHADCPVDIASKALSEAALPQTAPTPERMLLQRVYDELTSTPTASDFTLAREIKELLQAAPTEGK
jgi:hypothetical protein